MEPLVRVGVEGGELAMLRANPGGARGLVVLAHGFPDHPPTFAPVMDALAARDLDVVAPWLRGYAPSTIAGPFTADRLGADLLAIARTLAGRRPVYLVGHDWGAVATYAALAGDAGRTVTAAVTLSVPHPLAFLAGLRRDGQWRRSWYMAYFQLPFASRLTRARDFAFVDELWQTWSPSVRLPDAARGELHACLARSWPAPLAPYRALVRSREGVRAMLRRAARPITTPIRYLHGAADGCISPAAAAGQDRWLRGPLDPVILPGAGHFLQVEVPAQVAAQVDDWIARHPGDHGRR